MPVAIPDGTRVVCLQSMGSDIMVNVWHTVDTAPGAPPNLPLLRAAFVTFYTSTAALTPNRGINAVHGTEWVLNSVTTQRLGSLPFPDPTGLDSGVAGTGAGDNLPPQTALCLSLRTGISSRRARGRIYLGGITEGFSTDDTVGNPRPTTTLLNTVRDALTDLDANVNTAGAQLAVVSELDVVARPVTSVRVRNVWSTQRRRVRQVPATATTIVAV